MRVLLALVLCLCACGQPRQPAAAEHSARMTPMAADAGPPRADCYACHARDYASARRHPDVKPTRCAVCHVETGWHPLQLNHPWALTGAHERADCFACHKDKPPVYEHTPDACVDCHRQDYDESDYPGHDEFALTCADCHVTSGWKPAKKPEKKVQPTAAHAAAGAAHAKPGAGATAKRRPQPSTAAKPVVEQQPPAAEQTPPSAAVEPPAPEHPQPAAASKRKHPESAFPIETGDHTDIECETCHDGPGRMGKDNADCVQCHKRSRFDRKHTRVTDYPSGAAPANFCVECHTRGTRAVPRGR